MDPSAAEANRRFYSELAPTYDETEHCITSPARRDRLRNLLADALMLVPPAPSALDACGGSGNAAELLADRGLSPVVVDVSAEMLSQWRLKAERRGLDPEVHVGEVDAFLRADERSWDLIVFSSALHHLEDYTEVLSLAARRLSAGGLIATSFDPIRTTAFVRLIMRLDWLLWELVNHPLQAHRLIGGRLWRSGRRDTGRTIAQIAELHDSSGIDDLRLVGDLEGEGIEVVRHDRDAEARLGPVRLILRMMRAPSTFSLLLRRRPEPDRPTRRQADNEG